MFFPVLSGVLFFMIATSDSSFFTFHRVKSNSFHCVTNTTSAITWITDSIEKSSTYLLHNEKLKQSFSDWKLQNLLLEKSNYFLDDRWEELDIVETSRLQGSYTISNLSLTQNFNLGFSVRAASDFQIDLGSNGIACIYRSYKCSTGFWNWNWNNQLNANLKYLSFDRWFHFEMTRKDEYFYINAINGTSSHRIIKVHISNKNTIKNFNKIKIYSKSKTFWKFHRTTFMYSASEVKTNLGQFYRNKDGMVCLAMYVQMCEKCEIIVDASVTNSTQIFKSNTGWFQIKYILENVEHSVNLSLTTSLRSPTQNMFWAIDELRTCHKKEYRMLTISDPTSKCQLVSETDDDDALQPKSNTIVNSESSCPENTIGDFCMPCDLIKECEELLICSKKKCVCSAGYTKSVDAEATNNKCSRACEKGFYGHGCHKMCDSICNDCNNIDGTCPCYSGANVTSSGCGVCSEFECLVKIVEVGCNQATVKLEFLEISKKLNKTLSCYYVHLTKTTDINWIEKKKFKSDCRQNIQLFPLEANTEYMVTAVTDASDYSSKSEFFNITTFTTKCKEKLLDFKIEWSESSDLILSWTRPNVTYKPSSYFLITMSNGSATNDKLKRTILMTDANKNNITFFYKIDNTKIWPATNYNLILLFNNSEINEVEESKQFQSPPDLPKLSSKPIFYSTPNTISVTVLLLQPRGNFDKVELHVYISYNNLQDCKTLDKRTYLSVSKPVASCFDNKLKSTNYHVAIGKIKKVSENCSYIPNNKITELEPERKYCIILVLAIKYQNMSSVTMHSSLVGTEKRIKNTSHYNFLGLLALFLIPLIALTVYMKRNKLAKLMSKHHCQSTYATAVTYDKQKNCVSLKRSLENIKDVDSFCNLNGIQNNKTSSERSPIRVLELENYVKQSIFNGELERQHNSFLRGQTKPWDCGALLENRNKNRYPNLIAYDYNRVILEKICNDQFSDYINASYIDGDQDSKVYIATQGPKKSTLGDFWRMVWENNVEHIVMLANIVENGKKQVEQYWPDSNKCVTFDEIKIEHVSTKLHQNFKQRTFIVYCQEKHKKITQLHFFSWPDHGIPLYSQTLTPLLKKMLQIPLSPKSPIIVHCSAGVGRTGTILLCDICLRSAARQNQIDIFQTTLKLREQRLNMVDNIEQYKLAHLIILHHLQDTNTSVSSKDFDKYFSQLLVNNEDLSNQLQHLQDSQWQDEVMKAVSHIKPVNVQNKNRFPHIIPETQGQIFLSLYPSEDLLSSYINAVQVDSFQTSRSFIVTQQPLPNTVGDFWRMMDENQISAIVSLNEVDLNDNTSSNFWPVDYQQILEPADYITLKYVTTSSLECCNVTTLEMINKHRNSSSNVIIIAAKVWEGKSVLPKSTQEFLKFLLKSHNLVQSHKQVLVTCYDGVTASGLYVASAFIIDQIKLKENCDVYQAVKTIRRNRLQFIPNIEQLLFLYKVAQGYMKSVEKLN